VKKPRKQTLWILPAILLLGVLWRLPSLHDSFCDPDVAGGAYSCQELLNGGSLYGNTVETKPPLSYLLFAAVFAVFGRSMIFVHAVAIGWHLGVALCLFLLGRAMHDARTGLLAAFFYAGYSTTAAVNGLCPNFESWTLLPIGLMFVALWRHGATRWWGWLVLAGAFGGAALLFKQNVAPIVVALPLLLWTDRPDGSPGGARAGAVAMDAALIAVGAALPIAAVLSFFAARGEWRWLWDALTPSAAATYVSSEKLGFSYHGLLENGGKFVSGNVLLVVCFLWWLVFTFREKGAQETYPGELRASRFTGFWLFSALFSVMVGTKFFGHYFILLVPPLSLGAALLVSRTLSSRSGSPVAVLLSWIVVIGATGFGLRSETARAGVALAQLPTRGEFVQRVADAPFWWKDDVPRTLHWNRLLRKTGKCLARRTEPNETIFVWDYQPGLYWFAERRAPTRHFMYFNVAVDLPTGAGRWHAEVTPRVAAARAELMSELRARPPRYVILHRRRPADATHWAFFEEPAPMFDELQQWVTDHFAPDHECFNRYLVVLRRVD